MNITPNVETPRKKPRNFVTTVMVWAVILTILFAAIAVYRTYRWNEDFKAKSVKTAQPAIAAAPPPAPTNQPRNYNLPIWEIDGCKVYRRAIYAPGSDAPDVYVVKGSDCDVFVGK